MNSTSPMIEVVGPSTGRPAAGGREGAARFARSATVCRARYVSIPHSKSTQTIVTPTAVAERTLRTPGAPFMAVSRGIVTSCSMSAGATLGCSTTTVTLGAVKSGSTSTGNSAIAKPPQTTNATVNASTKARLSRDHRIRAFSICQWTCPCAGASPVIDARRTRYAPRVTTRSPALSP